MFTTDQLTAVLQPTADATGLPNAAYTSDQAFVFERDHLFADTWSAFAFCEDHNTPDAVTPLEFMGLPLLVACNRAGAIQVYHNVCSHRGTRLAVDKRQTNGLLVCPYHAWSYDLNRDGALRATPHIGGVDVHQADGFCASRHGLKPVRTHCWMGIIFINLSGRAPAFADYAAPLIERYRELVGDDESQMTVPSAAAEAGAAITAQCNWKLAVENYCEAYHLPWIHPSLNSYSPLSRHYCMQLGENFSGQGTDTFVPQLSGDALPLFPAWPEAQHKIAEYPVFYPNLLLGYQANHFYALILQPQAPAQTREELKIFYVGDGGDAPQYADARRENITAWCKVFNEDIGAVEGMQRGRHSPGFQGGAFSPVLDVPTHHFHQWVARKYLKAA